jgi:hypothetical protein
MNRLEQITADYWEVSRFLRDPDAPGDITAEKAFKTLSSSDRLRPTEWRLRELVHVITYDIIEGNTEWREQRRVINSVSILPTKG